MDKPIITTVTSQADNNAFQVNTATDELATAITGALGRDGTDNMTGNLNMNDNRVTNVAAPQASTDGARLSDVSDSDATGAASAQLRLDLLNTASGYNFDLIGNQEKVSRVYIAMSATTDTFPDIITALGSTAATILIDEAITVTSDIVVPSNVFLRFNIEGGFNVTSGKSLTLNCSIEDNIQQYFSGTGSVLGMSKTDFIRPEWFGAKGDYNVTTSTGTDDSPAFQAAVDCIVDNNLGRLRLSQSNYYFASPVTLVEGAYMIEGPNGGDREADVVDHSEEPAIYGAPGINKLFAVTDGSSDAMGGLEFNGIRFVGNSGGAYVESAIKIQGYGAGLMWPLIVQRCSFHEFNTAAIYGSQAAATYIVAFVSITKCAFQRCNYSILLDPANNNRCYGLYFEDNRCHQGGAIYGAFGGGVSIRNNNLEGQNTPITLTGVNMPLKGCIENNYFEENSGDYLMSVYGNSTDQTITIRNNFYYNCTNVDDIRVGYCRAIIEDEGMRVRFYRSYGISDFPYIETPAEGVGEFTFSTDAKGSAQRGLPTLAENSIRVPGGTTGHTVTPFGPRVYRTITSGSDAGTLSTWGTNMGDGDVLIMNILVKFDDVPDAGWMKWYDASSNLIFEGTASTPREANRWCIVTVAYRLDATPAAPTALRIEYHPYGVGGSGTGCDIAGVEAYKIANADVAATNYMVPYISRNQIISETAVGADATGTNVFSASANQLGSNVGFIEMVDTSGNNIYVPYWTNITP